MEGRSVGLKILWWAETILALRVLLFTIPVMINQYSQNNSLLSDPNGLFIVLLTVIAALYCVVGILSILGSRFWKAAHYLAVALTGAYLMAAHTMAGEQV